MSKNPVDFQKVLYLKGNLQQGFLQTILPYEETSINTWQISVSGISIVNKGAEPVNKVILLSTNIVKGIKGNLFSGKTVVCPPLWHLKCNVRPNNSEVLTVPQIYYNINNYSSDLIIYFSDMTTDKAFLSDSDVSITVIFKKIG